jgi:hypothetical protein
MAKPKGKPGLGCHATQDGKVTVVVMEDDKPAFGITMPAKDVSQLIANLFAAAIAAAKMSGQYAPLGANASLAGMPILVPTGLGISEGAPPEPTSLVIHAGMVRIGIGIPNPHEIGATLLTVSAPGKTAH